MERSNENLSTDAGAERVETLPQVLYLFLQWSIDSHQMAKRHLPK